MEITEADLPIDSRYRSLLGDKAGVVSSLHYELNDRFDADIMTSYARTAKPNVILERILDDQRVGRSQVEAGGKGETLEEAMNAALGESIERYCLRFPVADDDELIAASHEQMRSQRRQVPDFEYLDIWDREMSDRFAAAYEEPTRDSTFQWAPGTDLLDGSTVWVPAARAGFNVGGTDGDEERYFPSTSNGVAAGPDLESALLGSLYEQVERDGFMKAWCRQRSPPRIELSGDLAAFADRVFPGAGSTVHLFEFDPGVDVHAVGCAWVNDRDEVPKFVLGTGCSISLGEAVRDALLEAAQGIPYLVTLADELDLDSLDPREPDSFKSNPAYYALPENFDEISFLVEGPQGRTVSRTGRDSGTTSEELRSCLERFEDAGVTPIGFDMTTRGVRPTGIRVTRVLAPELVPITTSAVLPTAHPEFEGEIAGEDLTRKPHPSP